ncbi:MAG: HAMP domain-containing sensor histidine kinase [Candidatus Magasanikbacteria bacterium]
MKQHKKFQCEKKLGCPEYINKNCWLAKTLNNSPSKRCRSCSSRFSHCLFFQYLVISLALVAFLLAISFLVEGEISKLVIVCIFVLVIVYGYFFNKSTEKIIEANFAQRKATEALEELTEKLEEKVDAQTRDLKVKNLRLANLAHDLEKANLKLQELDRQKTEFLSIASHQLRTPLSIMKGYIELIEDGAFGKVAKPTVETLDKMNKSNERLVKLVDEFLDITRIEQGRTKFDFAKSDMNRLINSVVAELKERAQDKKLKIVWKPRFKNTNVMMDEEKVRHVVFNFIDNAIKYSTKGKIVVNLLKEKKKYIITVKDNGIGFDKNDEVNFFQKFYRGNNVKGTNVTGTGLGIYVCKKFIETHGGRVWAKSRGLGKGGEFGFWIPVKEKGKGEEKTEKS